MYEGPPIDDSEILSLLPARLRQRLVQVNGYIAYAGGLHVRGACRAPEWHSLRAAWFGDHSIHALFPGVSADDVPWAEDVLGDQFLLRAGEVLRLDAETGNLTALAVDLDEFEKRARADPFEYLRLAPLEQFSAEGGALEPGQLLSVYPPYCVAESANGVSLRAVSAVDRRRWLSTLAREVRALPEGAQVRLEIARPEAARRGGEGVE